MWITHMPIRTFRILAVAAVASRTILAADLLTLDQAIAIALDQNRGLHTSALKARETQENWNANRTRQFPSFSVNALGAQKLQSFDFIIEKGKLGNYPGTGSLPGEDVHLKSPKEPSGLMISRVSQPLSSLIRIRRNLDTLRTGVEIAQEQTRADRQKTVRDVRRAYYPCSSWKPRCAASVRPGTLCRTGEAY